MRRAMIQRGFLADALTSPQRRPSFPLPGAAAHRSRATAVCKAESPVMTPAGLLSMGVPPGTVGKRVAPNVGRDALTGGP